MLVADLDFALPSECEATEPPELRGIPRDRVRMLVSDRITGVALHARFDALPSFLRAGDLLVANDSATLPAALRATRANGDPLRVHVSSCVAHTLWVVEPRGDIDVGEALWLPGGASATLLCPVTAASTRLWYASVESKRSFVEYLQTYGTPIRYPYVTRTIPIAAYQTMFARVPGSAEMPSAGRPFTPAIVAGLAHRGVGLATITLHAGVSSPEAHEPPQPETFAVSPETAVAVNEARARGQRVIAIGTTVVRALESAVHGGNVVAASGSTERTISPERPPLVVDGLVTGLHEPKASHLAMLEAFLDRGALAHAYGEALHERYLWHEFGDVHLIAPL